MRVRVLGDISRLSPQLQQQIQELEQESAQYDGFYFQIALNYGSRDEMMRAMKRMYADVEAGKLSKEQMTEELFSGYLDTAGIPDPDLLIRTSGELRLSNYLLWQLAYSEFYFTDVPWPDFDEEELKRAVLAYNNRERRYGGLMV
ncbi:Isoprenyl transferase [Eubacterium plexicaudatum ASF492]|nr:Isoprenyl transferase [Eubacterium plexicaudatum ASF492]